ncbi:MAG: hypothetical protein U5P10_14825 [Spirochaetia bacterium]|nr:hypothetical protein [Spirochaetia bacterium]
MNTPTCPVCGSEGVKAYTKREYLQEPFGGQTAVELKEYRCPVCESTGDLFNENDELIEQTQNELKFQSVKNILDDFHRNKISMSALERALGIPQRTFTKWKNGNAKASATGITLLRFIRLFPWLVDVAENKYDYDTAQKIYIQSAVQKLLSKVEFDARSFSEAGIVSTSQSAFFYINYNKGEEPFHETVPATSAAPGLNVSEATPLYAGEV